MKKIKKLMSTTLVTMILSTSFSYANFNEKVKFTDIQNMKLLIYNQKNIDINDIFSIEMKKINEESEFFKSDIRYPNLNIKKKYINDKENNTIVIDNINKDIYKYITNFNDRIKAESEEYKKQYQEIFSKLKEQYVKYQYESYSDYQVTYNKNNLISIPMKLYEFTGGAHGMSYLKSFNYDLVSGKEVKLKDMFKDDLDYKTIVNNYIKTEIEKNKDIYFTGEEGFKGISDNQDFYIDKDGIVVYFGLYEIAPYYVGIPKFKMTWNEFEKYLNYNK
ncbi:MAG: DUF3298 and DUF4163 domain-containing protein [Romboutsia sp.]|uniref:DUF3298 and DUF4163 domain-containing protein n=1 Tax=Romboutsia sp. TaxID=1965302 RepID=UPI003F34AED0